jgi:hypothetical protein
VNLDAITFFYKQIPKDTRKQLLKTISDKDFMLKLAASLESSKTQGHKDDKSNQNDLAAYPPSLMCHFQEQKIKASTSMRSKVKSTSNQRMEAIAVARS